jgi:hypothetical protein
MSEYEAYTFQHNGYTVRIIQDEDAQNPRTDYDNAGVMVCFHGRYDLGDDSKKHDYESRDFNGWKELYDQIVKDHRPVAILPLALIDHSGISMYVGDSAHWRDPGGWDSGQVGFAFVSRETALKEWGKKIVTKRVRELAEKCLRAEVETYDQYLTGDVYGFTIETPDGEDVDSCWGFYGLDYCITEAKNNVPKEPAPVGGEETWRQYK